MGWSADGSVLQANIRMTRRLKHHLLLKPGVYCPGWTVNAHGIHRMILAKEHHSKTISFGNEAQLRWPIIVEFVHQSLPLFIYMSSVLQQYAIPEICLSM